MADNTRLTATARQIASTAALPSHIIVFVIRFVDLVIALGV